MRLNNNFLVGPVPASLGNLNDLIYLCLNDNLLSGTLPPELCNLEALTLLKIDNNAFEGCFPACYLNFYTQLTSNAFDGMEDIDNGNNFVCTWDDFCANNCLGCDIPCACTNPTACNYNANANCDDGSCYFNCDSSVWPGDVNVDGICNHRDIAYSHLFIGENGQSRNPGGISWQAQTCADWGIPQANSQDIKHHDCDGNGNINTNDANAINLNYNKTYPLPPGITAQSMPSYVKTNYQIELQPTNQITPNTTTLVMNVVMESKSNTDLEIFGGFFSIDIADIASNVENAFMSFESVSWLGIPNVNLLEKSWYNTTNNTIDVGFTKTNGVTSTGRGIIGKLIIELNTSILNRQSACENLLDITLHEISSFDENENPLAIENEYLVINLSTPCCQPSITINQSTPFQNLYKSSGTITTNNYLPIGQNQQVQYNANRVKLNSGFSVKAGADFKVRSSGCN